MTPHFLRVARARMANVESLLRNRSTDAPSTIGDFVTQADEVFRDDMKPIVSAVAASLQADDKSALLGLRAMLPHLLVEVNGDPVLTALLEHQIGKAVLEGLTADEPEGAA